MVHAPNLSAIQDRRCVDEMLPASPRRDAIVDALEEVWRKCVPEKFHRPAVDEVGLFGKEAGVLRGDERSRFTSIRRQTRYDTHDLEFEISGFLLVSFAALSNPPSAPVKHKALEM